MKTFFSFLTAGFATLVIMTSASAATKLSVQQSTLTLHGTSTLHDFECTTTKVQGTLELDSLGRNFVSAKITIPVKSIHSSSSSMDNNMFDALKADDNPTITLVLLQPTKAATKNNDSLQVKGDLTIAGKTKTIEMLVSLTGPDSGAYRLQGSYDLLMTDYGVDPPSFMFGAMKTGTKISIQFDLKLTGQ